MAQSQSTSVSKTFNKALLIVYVVTILLSLPLTYFLTRAQVLDQANKELSLLVDMVVSARNVVREETRPYFLPKNEFFAPVVSSTVMAKTVASKFAKLRPDYFIRIVSDNPLNPENLPKDLEKGILTHLRRNPDLKKHVEEGEIDGQRYLISAAPAKVKAGCMRCHGVPDEAPKQITDVYGKDMGFAYVEGNVVGASLVGVPMANVNALLLQRFLIILGILTLLFTLIVFILNRLVRNTIIEPILEITESAEAVSHGKSNRPMVTERTDEIGKLINSFELMRRSINLATKHLARMKK